eukprot:TRINITY_DN28266_c0_g2_i1.p2 TRINITY_DN28266_c0_g2~~TRINITY_DN28266_c0_g2_i1.p2  ORF type:complete len:105 (+),score=31.63 TRINITY_DN28266_c0_g2_i1:114-428(+)
MSNSTLFYSLFKSLERKGDVEVIVELKNGVMLRGVLQSVDPHLNMRLGSLQADAERYPQLAPSVGGQCFIRGSVVRYVQVPPSDVDTRVFVESCRKEVASRAGK